jgi:uncharacterized protein (DUF58 family)
MSETLIAFLVFLLLLGTFTQETFVIVLIYLGVGAVLLNRWWSNRSIKNLQFSRTFLNKVFPDEVIPVAIQVKNLGWLPAVWLRVQDLFPIEVADVRHFHQVITLGPRQAQRLEYKLKARKRGYYAIGPMQISTGDLLGLSPELNSQGNSDFLTVFPHVVPLTQPFLPSHSPLGTLRHHQRIHEDSTRPTGKRDYLPGDSLRRIDWKASAVVGRLQVKQFEPSIALETIIFLDLNYNGYNIRDRVEGTELAIVTAASLANWVVTKRQSVGLATNGVDILLPQAESPLIPIRKGRGHLMRILENLARIKALETTSLASLLRRHRTSLPWGSTLVLITGSADDALFDEALQAIRAGLSVVIILCGRYTLAHENRQRAKTIGIPVIDLQDMDSFRIWQR